MCFSVRSFGCALFNFLEELILEMLIIVLKKYGGPVILGVLLAAVIAYAVVNGSGGKPVDYEAEIGNSSLLFDLPVYNETNKTVIMRSKYNSKYSDADGNLLSHPHHYLVCSDNDSNRYFVTYALNGAYTKISGTLYASSVYDACWLEFYDENNRLLCSTIVLGGERNTKSCSVIVNVTGVNYLTIKMCAKYNPSNGNHGIISKLEIQ